ncbi:unnamed protein product, partial [Mesorhabditis spiculigera]
MTNMIISNNSTRLSRPLFCVRIYAENGQIQIAHNKLGHSRAIITDFSTLDFDQWLALEIAKIELVDMAENGLDTTPIFERIIAELINSENFHVSTLLLQRVKLGDDHAIRQFFRILLPRVQQLLIEDSTIPFSISDVFGPAISSQLTHYRSLNTVAQYAIADSARLLANFTQQLPTSDKKNTFHFEVDSIAPDALASFIQTWSTMEGRSAYFNITASGCTRIWREAFIFAARQQGLHESFLEFRSKRNQNTMIKMVIDQSNNTCRLWPIFDAPARTAGQLICHDRFYRDF